MSVAFRREDDDAHREPKFELPIPPGPNLVTPRGLVRIAARVAELEVPADADPIVREAALRDLRYWRTRLATARLMPPPSGSEAAFGSRVRLALDGRERTIEIVGDDEADPAEGRIAFSAPLARALIGGGVGDLLAFGGREDAILVLEVSAI